MNQTTVAPFNTLTAALCTALSILFVLATCCTHKYCINSHSIRTPSYSLAIYRNALHLCNSTHNSCHYYYARSWFIRRHIYVLSQCHYYVGILLVYHHTIIIWLDYYNIFCTIISVTRKTARLQMYLWRYEANFL